MYNFLRNWWYSRQYSRKKQLLRQKTVQLIAQNPARKGDK